MRLTHSCEQEPAAVFRETLDFERLFREHAATVSRWVAGIGGPSVDVEDAVQDVFIVAHRRLPEFRGEAKVSTWLFRITHRVARSHRRRARRRRWLGGSADEVGGRLEAPQLDPVEELVRKQAIAELYAVLDQLNEKFRTVLVLANFEGLEAQQIATMTGVTPTTARVWLHRARLKFRRLMAARRQGEGRA